MQVSGAQRRSVMHNVVLHPRGVAQHSSHKPMEKTHGDFEIDLFQFCLHLRVLPQTD